MGVSRFSELKQRGCCSASVRVNVAGAFNHNVEIKGTMSRLVKKSTKRDAALFLKMPVDMHSLFLPTRSRLPAGRVDWPARRDRA